MRALTIIIGLTFATASVVSGSNYHDLYSTGIDEDDLQLSLDEAEDVLISYGDDDDQLSPIFELPFEWEFFGEEVTHFRASTNGYITFDTARTETNGQNTALPDEDAPGNAIFALWDDFELGVISNPQGQDWESKVLTFKYGTEPNRVFVIKWLDIHHADPEPGDLNAALFSIRIFENGEFSFAHHYIGDRINPSATIGAQNYDGTEGIMSGDSPEHSTNIDDNFDPENSDVWTYIEGERDQYSLMVDGEPFYARNVIDGESTEFFEATLWNYGSETLNSLTVKYSDDGNVHEKELTDLDAATNESFSFSLEHAFEGAGEFHPVEIWFEAPNGEDYEYDEPEFENEFFGILGESVEKNVLMEEFTTANCVFCPEGALIKTALMEQYENLIGVSHHAGFGTDAMTISENEMYAMEFSVGTPSAVFDRTDIENEGGEFAASRIIWEDHYLKQNEINAPVSIEINPSLDMENREVEIEIDGEFVDYAEPQDLQLTVFLVEDSVNRDEPGYYQSNGYNQVQGHPLEGLGDPIEDYYHRTVVREVLTPAWGDIDALNIDAAEPGDMFSTSFNATIPEGHVLPRYSIVAFVGFYDNDDHTNREVLNASTTSYFHEEFEDVKASIQPNEDIAYISNLYPNPAENVLHLETSFESFSAQQKIEGEIISLSGQSLKSFEIESGQQSAPHQIDVSGLETGLYMLQLNHSEGVETHKFNVK